MSAARVSTAVHVLVYEVGPDQYWCAVKREHWRLASRWSLRLSRTRRITSLDPCPPGVDQDLWWAYSALRSLVTEQVREYRDGPAH